MNELLRLKEESIKRREGLRRSAKKLNINEDKKTDALKIEISRLVLKIGIRAKKAKGDELQALNTAVGLLNQATAIADIKDTEARKLLALSRSFIQGRKSNE